MEDMKKLAEEQLEGVTGGGIREKLYDPAFQARLVGMDVKDLKALLIHIDSAERVKFLAGLKDEALIAKLKATGLFL